MKKYLLISVIFLFCFTLVNAQEWAKSDSSNGTEETKSFRDYNTKQGIIDSLRQKLEKCEKKNLPRLQAMNDTITGAYIKPFYEIKSNSVSMDLNHWLLNLLDDYAKECKKDTFIISKDWYDHLYFTTFSLKDRCEIVRSSDKLFYCISRPTFEGFTAWLRKRVNE